MEKEKRHVLFAPIRGENRDILKRRKSRKEEAKMARFSLGRDDDDADEGPSNNDTTRRVVKRLRITPPSTGAATNHHPGNDDQVIEDGLEELEEEEEDESGSNFESKEEDHETGNEAQVAEDAVDGVESGGGGGDSVGPIGSSVLSVTLTDPDVLDCPICFDSLTIPVFQCENGHIACFSCCIKIANKCPSCSWPIGYNRCRAIEKVLESVKISCRFGCKETLPYSNKYEHERSCASAPCSCPLDDCNFVGSSKHLYAHFSARHPNSAKSFRFNCSFFVYLEKNRKSLILQEQTEGIIFILNHSSERLGSAVNVMSIGSMPSGKWFCYDIICRGEDSLLKLKSFAESTRQWSVHHPLRKYLLVPSDFIVLRDRLQLEVCIRVQESSSGI